MNILALSAFGCMEGKKYVYLKVRPVLEFSYPKSGQHKNKKNCVGKPNEKGFTSCANLWSLNTEQLVNPL